MRAVIIFIMILSYSFTAFGAGNTTNDSFVRAKRILEQEIYYDHRLTIYCGAEFDEKKRVCLPDGFETKKHKKRAERVEWEHLVPAENFGRAFVEWREGDPICVDKKGRAYKGRKCAGKANREYRLMEADMYNLYPVIGAVNATRSNHNFQMLDKNTPSAFGTCQMKVEGNKVEPPVEARGVIARAYKYMDDAYPKYRMSDQQRKLMNAWDKMYPVDEWECQRAKRIEAIQGNENIFVKSKCIRNGLW